jgi:hypothetical protein
MLNELSARSLANNGQVGSYRSPFRERRSTGGLVFEFKEERELRTSSNALLICDRPIIRFASPCAKSCWMGSDYLLQRQDGSDGTDRSKIYGVRVHMTGLWFPSWLE